MTDFTEYLNTLSNKEKKELSLSFFEFLEKRQAESKTFLGSFSKAISVILKVIFFLFSLFVIIGLLVLKFGS
jgi:hypothetical protein